MIEDREALLPKDEPIFIKETKELLEYLISLDFDSAKKLLATNENNSSKYGKICKYESCIFYHTCYICL